MEHKREEAHRAAEARARAAAERRAGEERAKAAAAEEARSREEVIPWLRALGVRPDRARRAAEHPSVVAEAALEERVRAALRSLSPS